MEEGSRRSFAEKSRPCGEFPDRVISPPPTTEFHQWLIPAPMMMRDRLRLLLPRGGAGGGSVGMKDGTHVVLPSSNLWCSWHLPRRLTGWASSWVYRYVRMIHILIYVRLTGASACPPPTSARGDPDRGWRWLGSACTPGRMRLWSPSTRSGGLGHRRTLESAHPPKMPWGRDPDEPKRWMRDARASPVRGV